MKRVGMAMALLLVASSATAAENFALHRPVTGSPICKPGEEAIKAVDGKAADEHAAEADDGGDGHAAGDLAHDGLALVLHGHAEIAVEQIIHINKVLFKQGLIQPVPGLQGDLDALRRLAGDLEGLAGDGVHQEKCHRRHQEQGHHHG